VSAPALLLVTYFLTAKSDRKLLRILQWESLLRRGKMRPGRMGKRCSTPVIIERQRVLDAGESLPIDQKPDLDLCINGHPVAWPIRRDLSFGRWKVGNETLRTLIGQGVSEGSRCSL
jgi:adenine-specific DNA-methyltransferase